MIVLIGACGSSGGASLPGDPRVPCVDDDPGAAATYANADVAFARDPRKPEGAELQSDRFEGELPWFAKAGLYVRGNGAVLVRVPIPKHDVVKISGWSGTGDRSLRTAVLVQSTSRCPSNWMGYPGGLAFSGRQCVRLLVEGPGDATGSALFGLRKDCSRRR